MVKIVWTERSLTDLEDIAGYIAKDSVKYAKITIEKILNEISILENRPLIGRIVPELNDENYRELIIGNYRILYEHDKIKISILTVHNSKRELRKKSIFQNRK